MEIQTHTLLQAAVDWLATFVQPSLWIELLTLASALVLAWFVTAGLRRLFTQGDDDPNSILFGRRLFDGVLFPLALLGLAYAGRSMLLYWGLPLGVFRVVIPALLSLAAIRTGVKVLQVAMDDAPWVRAVERTISWLAWGAALLWITGVLPLVLHELDQITWTMGKTTLSVRTLIEGVLSAGVVLILALWVSAAIEARLLRKVTGSQLSLRKALSNATRALLMFVGLMAALSAVGIDLTALSVLGGAIGVGIGFGLQKLAANYVSGFVILAERSMRIGDTVRVDNFEGRITDINMRYTVIRTLTGRESVVPNEMLLTNRVENLSLADPKVWLSTVVSVAYDSDVEQVQALLVKAAEAHSRVLRDPAPTAAMSAFGADGLEFTLGFWIIDPENGQAALRSDINISILKALRAHGIEIPYPQRVLHMQASPAVVSAPSGPAATGQ